MLTTGNMDVVIRSPVPEDRDALLALADRLLIGMAPWRDREGCATATRSWVEAAFQRTPEQGSLLVASDPTGEVLGFIGVSASEHFSGEPEGYIGELVVDERAEGRGIGQALVTKAETWARSRGFRTLTLDTGAANHRARRFYANRDYLEEGVRMTKVL